MNSVLTTISWNIVRLLACIIYDGIPSQSERTSNNDFHAFKNYVNELLQTQLIRPYSSNQ